MSSKKHLKNNQSHKINNKMKNIRRFLIFIVLFGQSVFSQEQFKTSLKVEQVRQQFSKGGKISWAVPISQRKTLSVVWQERPNSLAGIQTFVGYKEDELIGMLSIDATSVSGNFNYDGSTYKITSEKRNIVVVKEDEDQHQCGLCASHKATSKTQRPTGNGTPDVCTPNTHGYLDNHCLDNIQIYTDGVLRIYRLALLINYNKFAGEFQSDKTAVRRFWAETEAFANELYVRAVAVKFKIVDDDRLILDTPEKEVLKEYHSGTSMLENQRSTQAMNTVISPEDYDVGLIITFLPWVNGQAALDAVFEEHTKADGVVGRGAPSTVAHELGHMFGADHTHNTQDSGKVEPESGRSIMGYGHSFPRDFFTLYSVHSIRKGLTHSAVYFSDEQRTQKVILSRGKNPVYGIKTQNRRPVIDASDLKPKYVIPKNTFFQFRINASDPDNDKLLYAAHQTDIRLQTNPSNAVYYSAKPSYNNLIRFQKEYKSNRVDEFPSVTGGIYRFWLAVSDGILGTEALTNQTHATHYDMVKTDVEVKNTTPFRINPALKKQYGAGEEVTLRWDVATDVFGTDSRVRILLSDDFGQTFKHIITPEAPNNGTFTFTMPHIPVGKTGNQGHGLIKIEVIDHIAYALSEHNPYNGGFEVVPSQIVFENLPEPTISALEGAIPEPHSVQARTSCNGQAQVQVADVREANRIKRTFTAVDDCQNRAIFVQYIFVKEDVPPLQFVGNLPQDRVYHCDNTFDKAVPNVQVTGGKSPQITLTQTRMESDYHINYILKRTWRVTDPVAAPIEHTQLVFVYDNTNPILVTQPNDIVVNDDVQAYTYAEIPPVAFDNCGNQLQWRKPISPDYTFGANGLESILVTWEARDGTDNPTRVTQKIIVDKNHTDIYFQNLPADMQLSCKDGVPSADIELKVVNCASAEVTHTENQTWEGNKKIITRVYTATGCGKTLSATQRIVVTDDEAPVFTGDLPLSVEVATTAEVPPLEDLTATDNCFQGCTGQQVVITTQSDPRNQEYYNTWEVVGNQNCVKSVPVTKERKQSLDGKTLTDTWTATDEFGNTQTYTRIIKVASADVPTMAFVNFPKDINLPCNGVLPQAENISISGCENATVTHTDELTGNCKDGKTVVRTYTASGCRQTISQKQTITIAGDNEAPTFSGTLPQDVSITENQTIPTQEELTATDNCSQRVQVTKSQEERQENGNKIVIYRWTATDDCGNEKRHSQTITIVPAPKISFINFPTDVNLSCGEDKPQAETKLPISGCGGTTEIAVTHTDTETGDCKTGKTIERTYTASACGQTISQKQTITIAGDNEAPTFSGTRPKDISVVEGQKIPTQGELTATDNCSQRVQVAKSQEERQESGNKIIIYRWTATDDCGNEKRHSQTITIVPAPKISFINFPTDVNLSCGKAKPQAETKLPISGCEGTTEIAVTHTDTETGDCKTGKTIERTYTASACGQTISQKQTITIAGDSEAPTFSGTRPKDISVVEGQKIPTQGELTATDNCSQRVQVAKSQEERQESGNKIVIYRWTATDECGNTFEYAQKITVLPKSTGGGDNNQGGGNSPSNEDIIVYNGVFVEEASDNYLRIAPIERYTDLYIEIFNELGQKVFQAKDYQRKGGVFRGYANVKGVVGKGKRLPSGTYFYVLKYKNQDKKMHQKSGYLYVR
ncbi:hypothetical protein CGC49_07035 [Capnocytophaga sp. H4358]|nr:hypothetical protein CGC49_07035 [Capnocytophaga sp. H4358]